MRTRIWAGLVIALLLPSACSSSEGAGDVVTTTRAVAPAGGAGNTASDDPAWDDNSALAELVESCVATRSRLAEYTGIPETQLASGCLADARVLQATGCSVANATLALIDPDPDRSQGQCPA